MQIPYTVDPRPDTGLYNAKLGIWLFLASEVMLFGALFSSYILLRTGAPVWPHGREMGLSVPLATLNTLVLIGSSVTMVMSWASLKLKDFSKFRFWMGLTILCAVGFMVIKGIEYHHKFEEGALPGVFYHFSEVTAPGANLYYTVYFLSTGLHAFHVIIGMSILIWILARVLKGEFSSNNYVPVELGGLYWHLVDLVWIFLFPLLYLI
jgi:heme/copper-type cytochrome/quinol oxidase subunit 3